MLSKFEFGKFKQFIYHLDCGLEIQYFPYPDYHTNLVGFIVPNGSNMSEYVIDGKKVKTGIAHFLEHRMFESSEKNMMNEFALLGASVNAYTSFDKTCYHYSTSSNSLEPFKLLFELVTSFYSTSEQIENEKKIILEESKMRQSSPMSSLNREVNQNLYIDSYLKDPIVGYKEDILSTTLEDLTLAYESFYSLDKMILVIVGPNNVQDYIDYINTHTSHIKKANHSIRKIAKKEDLTKVKLDKVVVSKDISNYINVISFKIDYKNLVRSYNNNQFIAIFNIALDLLFSNSSSFYDQFNQIDKVITNSLSDYYFDDGNIANLTIAFVTSVDIRDNLDKYTNIIFDALNNPSKYFNQSDYDLYKKQLIMNHLSLLTNLDSFFDEVLDSAESGYNLLEYYSRNDFATLDDLYSFIKKLGQSKYVIGHLIPKGV